MKLHIFGAAGSGVTTLGKALSEELRVPYLDSDDFFWVATEIPFSTRRPPAERNAAVTRALSASDDWILGGSVIHWGEGMFPAFDLIVFLHIPLAVRLDRLRAREYERYGEALRADPERKSRFDAFMAWAAAYEDGSGGANRTLEAHEAWLADARCPVLRIGGDTTIGRRMDLVKARLGELRRP